jgi:hypothetical protein
MSTPDSLIKFSQHFSLAFPEVKDMEWFKDSEDIAERLNILLNEPSLAWWWRGMKQDAIQEFSHVENNDFLMDIHELHIVKIAALNLGEDYQKAVYVEVKGVSPTGVYPTDSIDEIEEYGLVDGKIPVTREALDNGEAFINDELTDIRGRVEVRFRYIKPYNFIIIPDQSSIRNNEFVDPRRVVPLGQYLDQILKGQDVLDRMCNAIRSLPKIDRSIY